MISSAKRDVRSKAKAELQAKGNDFASYYSNRMREIACFWTWPLGHAYPDEYDSDCRCVGCGKVQGTIPQW